MNRIVRALLSVYDKTGIETFARRLAGCGLELISTGGTARALRAAGLSVVELSDFTGFPEMLDGRVKTLHPRVHAGLLFLRGEAAHEAAMREHGLGPIDLVVVNLYPFEAVAARPGAELAEVIENIDIGGPAMLRSAAKNHPFVTVITDPADYDEVAAEIEREGNTTLALRQRLAVKVYARTAAYDRCIADELGRRLASGPEERGAGPDPTPPFLNVHAPRAQTLRYGENPHQSAALYGAFGDYFHQLHGRELSYNNILDLTAAASLLGEFESDPPTLAILKHTNPCGVGQGKTLREAWDKALATDRQAPFGGIIGVNRRLDGPCAEAIAEIFSEVIVAPGFSPEALAILERKKNLRLLEIRKPLREAVSWEIRSVGADSYLWQQAKPSAGPPPEWRQVTLRSPTPDERRAMEFGWRVVTHVKSNAIVFAGPDRTLGIGAGQMSRVDACRLAVWKAREAGLPLAGSVVCSDAFFPFPDGLAAAAEAGATAAVQPGGSVRDAEVIEAANQWDLAMVLTGIRQFRH